MKSYSKVTGPTVVAAIVASAGAALAITLYIRRYASRRTGSVLARCDRAVGELERNVCCATGSC